MSSIISALRGIILDFGTRAFTAGEMTSKPKRAMRVVEEAAELAQSVYVDKDKLHQIIDMVYSRPPGTTFTEVGDLMNTIVAFGAAAAIDPEFALETRMRQLLGEPIEKFQKRAKEKLEAGL